MEFSRIIEDIIAFFSIFVLKTISGKKYLEKDLNHIFSAIYFFILQKFLKFISILLLMGVNAFDKLKITSPGFTMKEHESFLH